jgi:hypothetical protein
LLQTIFPWFVYQSSFGCSPSGQGLLCKYLLRLPRFWLPVIFGKGSFLKSLAKNLCLSLILADKLRIPEDFLQSIHLKTAKGQTFSLIWWWIIFTIFTMKTHVLWPE